MALVIIANDNGEEISRTRVTGVEDRTLVAVVLGAVAKIPPPRKTRSDAGQPKGPRTKVLPHAANVCLEAIRGSHRQP